MQIDDGGKFQNSRARMRSALVVRAPCSNFMLFSKRIYETIELLRWGYESLLQCWKQTAAAVGARNNPQAQAHQLKTETDANGVCVPKILLSRIQRSCKQQAPPLTKAAARKKRKLDSYIDKKLKKERRGQLLEELA